MIICNNVIGISYNLCNMQCNLCNVLSSCNTLKHILVEHGVSDLFLSIEVEGSLEKSCWLIRTLSSSSLLTLQESLIWINVRTYCKFNVRALNENVRINQQLFSGLPQLRDESNSKLF